MWLDFLPEMPLVLGRSARLTRVLQDVRVALGEVWKAPVPPGASHSSGIKAKRSYLAKTKMSSRQTVIETMDFAGLVKRRLSMSEKVGNAASGGKPSHDGVAADPPSTQDQ
jgi:hypothetical protein